MEANNEMAPETPDIPTMEQGMVQDTQESNTMDFNEIIGAPQQKKRLLKFRILHNLF